MSDLKNLLRPIQRAIGNMLARCVVSAVNASTKMQGLQIRLMAGEGKGGVEHFEPYGLTAHPHAGAEGVALFFDGDRSHGVVICVADRRYRLKDLEAGEVALYDDQGQKVHLTRDGMVIDGGGKPIVINNAPSVTVTSPLVTLQASSKVRVESLRLESTGDIEDRCDLPEGTTMAWIRSEITAMKSRYNTHTHTEYDVAGSTSGPNNSM